MHTTVRHIGAAVLATLAAAASPSAGAQSRAPETSAMDRVEISGKRQADSEVRTDIYSACANIQAQLQDKLEGAWNRVAEPGEVRVDILMRGSQVSEVHASNGSVAYYPYVRRAVSHLACPQTLSADEAHHFAFIVRILDPQARGHHEPSLALKSVNENAR